MAAMTSPAQSTVRMRRNGNAILLETDHYRLGVADAGEGFAQAPFLSIFDAAGGLWTRLALLAQVDTRTDVDENFAISPLVVRQLDGAVEFSVTLSGTAWQSKRVVVTCLPASVELRTVVTGVGDLDDVVLLGGHTLLANGASGVFRSSIDFRSVFVPSPTEPVSFVRPANSAAVLGVVGDADAGRLNAVFSPPPLALGFSRAAATLPEANSPDALSESKGDSWLGLSIQDDVRALTFTSARYEPLDGGFLLRLSYEGHTRVDGEWTSPVVILRPAASGWDVLRDYRADLLSRGSAASSSHTRAAWWSEPIFCGWGAQCARFVADRRARRARTTEPEMDAILAALEEPAGEPAALAASVVTGAMELSRQDVYDELLATLEASGITPGTIVIDDRWQAEYGTAEPDLAHWPDLAGWIRQRHDEGRKVLLWWKAWDPQGIPADECVVDASGRPVAVDPANPAYLARLEAIVTRLVAAGGLDADGFKIDFTQRAPSGRTLAARPGVWGIAALHAMLETIYRAAKAAKPDALVITHAIHPSFGSVSDMVRLNDVLEEDVDGLLVPVVNQVRMRAGIASAVLPQHLIDTDQWPMPNRQEWLAYVGEQPHLGVPALYYVESIDNSGEAIDAADLAVVKRSWHEYRERSHRA